MVKKTMQSWLFFVSGENDQAAFSVLIQRYHRTVHALLYNWHQTGAICKTFPKKHSSASGAASTNCKIQKHSSHGFRK